MKLSIENRRISVTDNIDLALTKCQQQVFAHWEQGFDAQGRGLPFESCPHVERGQHKVRNVWRQGWLSGAAVDRIKHGLLAPSHNPTQQNAIRK
jgi:hypothetical protein